MMEDVLLMFRAARKAVCNETDMMACGKERFSSLQMPSLDSIIIVCFSVTMYLKSEFQGY